MKQLNFLDRVITSFDNALRTLACSHTRPASSPDDGIRHQESLSDAESKQSEQLMRVNHTGEVCAQALYQGQLLFAKDPITYQKLDEAALEETYHLVWCEKRLHELGGRTSLLNPFFYAGSFTLGAVASFMGDKVSLGFLAETEKQVENHLDGHLAQLPENDAKSRAIVRQMRDDEIKHRETAIEYGGEELPDLVKSGMTLTAKLMTSTTKYI